MTVTLGLSAIIVCNITLNTAIGPDLSVLNYTWYQNNIDITNSSEILDQNNTNNTITTIHDIMSVQLSDAGVYECSAGIIGNNLTMNAFSKSCIQGIAVLISSTLYNTILLIVAETKFPTQQHFSDLQLGKNLTVSCINEHLHPGIFVSWLDSNGLYYSTNNTLVIPSLQLSHNNTICICVISIRQNPFDCQNQSKKYTIKEKRKR